MISHKGMISMVRGLSQILEFRTSDSVVSVLPLCHIAERMFSLIFPMYVGYTVNFAESVNTLQEDMKEISPVAFLNVPRIWEKMHSKSCDLRSPSGDGFQILDESGTRSRKSQTSSRDIGSFGGTFPSRRSGIDSA
jgi:long-chain acyl-CoA synthetase